MVSNPDHARNMFIVLNTCITGQPVPECQFSFAVADIRYDEFSTSDINS
jgi:hypothetical protein